MNVFRRHDSNGTGNTLLFFDRNLFFQFLRNRSFKTVCLIDLFIDQLCCLCKFFFVCSKKYDNVFIPAEPRQTEERRSIVPDNNVPADAIYKVFHMGGRDSDDFYACDIISDILSNGQSSRLYVNLIKNQRLFSGIDAYVSGDRDPGLFIFSGKLSEGIDIRQAEAAIDQEIEHFIKDEITVREVEKIIHKTEARISYSEISYQSKASNLAFFEFLGDVDLINTEGKRYNDITVDKIKTTARELFRKENCSTLWYLKK